MKILIVASNMVHIKNFHLPYIEKMKNLGHSVYIMANGEGADFQIPFEKSTLSFKNFRLSFKIRKIIKNNSFDAVFLHTSLAAFWTRLAMKGMKKRPTVVNTVHGYLFGNGCTKLHNFVYLSCERLLKKQTDSIIVMNNEDYKIATGNKLSLGDVYFINGMGVDFKKQSHISDFVNENGKNLTFVGEISKRKNQIILVKAMKYLPDEYTLTLVGDGDERGTIEKYIRKNNLEKRVQITGFTQKVYEYINKADIYVSASKIEGLPFNIMEAMYLKKPIIASRIKGHTDLLDEKCLFCPHRVEELVSLIKSTEIKEVFYEIDKYSKDSILDENVALYLSLVGDKKQQAVV